MTGGRRVLPRPSRTPTTQNRRGQWDEGVFVGHETTKAVACPYYAGAVAGRRRDGGVVASIGALAAFRPRRSYSSSGRCLSSSFYQLLFLLLLMLLRSCPHALSSAPVVRGRRRLPVANVIRVPSLFLCDAVLPCRSGFCCISVQRWYRNSYQPSLTDFGWRDDSV